MNANNEKIQSALEAAFVSAVSKLTVDEAANYHSDLYVQADPESGELQIYDEKEQLLEKVVIPDWVGSDNEESFRKKVVGVLKPALAYIASKKVFDSPHIVKPFSVSLTDDDFGVTEELLFLDDDLLRLDDPLLKDLDSELDDFLAKLLSDVE